MKQTKVNEYTNNTKKLILLILILTANQIFAAFEINKHTINSGGSKSTSQGFQLNGSIAQVDANTTLSSNRYQITPGFWQQNTDLIFTNGFK